MFQVKKPVKQSLNVFVKVCTDADVADVFNAINPISDFMREIVGKKEDDVEDAGAEDAKPDFRFT